MLTPSRSSIGIQLNLSRAQATACVNEQSFFPGDPATVWGHLAAELEVERIPGDHLNIVTTEFEGLASALTRYIRQVSPQHIG